MQVRQGAARAAKSVAQRRLAVLDLKRATAIGVVMQRMKCAAQLPFPDACSPLDPMHTTVLQCGREGPSVCRNKITAGGCWICLANLFCEQNV